MKNVDWMEGPRVEEPEATEAHTHRHAKPAVARHEEAPGVDSPAIAMQPKPAI
jgi:nitrate reductase / nitrite oxidoreductase, alpha subunit